MTYTNLTYSGTPKGYYFSYHGNFIPNISLAEDAQCADCLLEFHRVRKYRRKVCEFSCTIVSHLMNISNEDLCHPTRLNAEAAFARQVAMYAAHVGFSLSQRAVGRFFKRDRTTVAHACRLVEDMRDDEAFDQMMSQIEFVINAARDGFEALLDIDNEGGCIHDA